MSPARVEPVLTVTLNPAIDLDLRVDELRRGGVARAIDSTRRAGGKGINVARALAELGVRAAAVIPLGGAERELFLNLLFPSHGYRNQLPSKPNFFVFPISISESVRTNITIGRPGDGYLYKINQPGPHITRVESKRIVDEIVRLARGRKWVAISGSLPPGMDAGTYARIVRLVHEAGAKAAIDCEGEPLTRALKEKPELVRINRRELEKTIARKLRTRGEVIDAMRELQSRGTGMIAIGDGPRTAIGLDEQGNLFQVQPPRKFKGSVVGAGDAMLARIIAGLLAGLEFGTLFNNAITPSAIIGLHPHDPRIIERGSRG